MSRRKQASRDFRALTVTGPEAAAFLKVPERSFYRLVETGIIPKSGEGEYLLGDIVEAYWRNQFDSEGLTAARTRLVTAQAELAEAELAELAEAELAEQRGELHRASAIRKIWAERNVNIKSRLLAIPSKIAPELVGQDLLTIREKLKVAVNEALKELAEYDAGQITSTALLAD